MPTGSPRTCAQRRCCNAGQGARLLSPQRMRNSACRRCLCTRTRRWCRPCRCFSVASRRPSVHGRLKGVKERAGELVLCLVGRVDLSVGDPAAMALVGGEIALPSVVLQWVCRLGGIAPSCFRQAGLALLASSWGLLTTGSQLFSSGVAYRIAASALSRSSGGGCCCGAAGPRPAIFALMLCVAVWFGRQ